MDQGMLLFLSVGLAMDAFAVSVSDGLCWRGSRKMAGLVVALAFGIAQGLMPTLGYLGGQAFAGVVHRYQGIIALFLLGSLGGKMLWESWRCPAEQPPQCFSLGLVLVQALATSIDALAVGLGLAVMEVSLLWAVGEIALVTFLLCLLGFGMGRRFGQRVGAKAGRLGGGILIWIGLRLFMESLH